MQEKLNEAIMMLNKNLQEININNMDTELVAQMFKNYQSNVLFHLEGRLLHVSYHRIGTDVDSYKWLEGSSMKHYPSIHKIWHEEVVWRIFFVVVWPQKDHAIRLEGEKLYA